MPLVVLDLRVRAAVAVKHAPLISTSLSRGYFPRRGLFYSVLVHELAFIGLLYLPDSIYIPVRPLYREQDTIVELNEPREIMYLPNLGNDDPGKPTAPIKSKAGPKSAPVAPPRATEGLSYPGKQPVLSDFPKPTNYIQTVLQPALDNPPVLKPPLMLPNFVLTADAGPVPNPAGAPPITQPTVRPSQPVLPAAKVTPPAAADTPMFLPGVIQNAPVPETKPPGPPPKPEPLSLQLPKVEPLARPVRTAQPELQTNPLPPPKPESVPVQLPKVEPLARPVQTPQPELQTDPVPPPRPESLLVQMPKVEPLVRPVQTPMPELQTDPLPPPKPESLPVQMPKVEPLSKPSQVPKQEVSPALVPPPRTESTPTQLPKVEPLRKMAQLPKAVPQAKPAPPPKAESSSRPGLPSGSAAQASQPDPGPKTLAPREPPKLEVSTLPVRGPDKQNLLALTPLPAQRDQQVSVPTGEALGRFAILPNPNLAASGTDPGAKPETPPAGAAAKNTAINAPLPAAGGTAATAATVAVKGIGTKDAATKDATKGAATKDATTKDAATKKDVATKDKDAAGSAAGSDKARITVIGGVGAGPGSGSGSGAGKGRSAFEGITITGGVTDTGIAGKPATPPRTPRPLQTAYDVTVMTTENSGGGLPYFGVFSQKQVYTVYLDMRQTEVDTAPSWTLEFAVLEDSPTLAGAAKDPAQNQQGLVLPFPAIKPPPVLPAEIVRRHLRKMVIVYAVINIEGKMEQLSVKDSPDPLLNEPILTALRKWVFRPARLNGEPVSTIILLGIPLWISE